MEIKKLAKTLEDIKNTDDSGIEYWFARELYPLLGYKQWRNFSNAIEKAQHSCITSGEEAEEHFVGASKTLKSKNQYGETEGRSVNDYRLTRYACYLIAQNGDPRISEIAFAQMYFAIQTRKQEIIEQNIEEIERLVARQKLTETEKDFTNTIYSRGVDSKGLQEIRSAGDKELFGGYDTQAMKKKLKVENQKKPLADYLPTVTIKAKDLAAEMTTFNTKRKNLQGKSPIKKEHMSHNKGARKLLTDGGIYPEKLPSEEDIKQLEKKHKKNKKLLDRKKKKIKKQDKTY